MIESMSLPVLCPNCCQSAITAGLAVAGELCSSCSSFAPFDPSRETLSDADADLALEASGLLPPPKTTAEALARYEARVKQLRADINSVIVGWREDPSSPDLSIQLSALRRELSEAKAQWESFRHQHQSRN